MKSVGVFGGIPNVEGSIEKLIAKGVDEEFCKNDDKKILHLLENYYYYKIVPDVNGDFFYRINTLAIDYDKDKSNNFGEKKILLTIFNNKFEIIYTLDLNDRNYILSGGFSTEQGFFLPALNGTNTLRFKLVKFKKI